MSGSERETTSEKKPAAVEQKSENFKGAALRWFKALDSPTGFLLTMIGLAGAYFVAIEWRVGLLVKDPEFVAKVAQRVPTSHCFRR